MSRQVYRAKTSRFQETSNDPESPKVKKKGFLKSLFVKKNSKIKNNNTEEEDLKVEKINIKDMKRDGIDYTYKCICGDFVKITAMDIIHKKTLLTCPTCSRKFKVIVDETFMKKLKKKFQS